MCPAPQCHDKQVIANIDALPRYTISNMTKQHLRILRQMSEKDVSCQMCSSSAAEFVCMSCSEGKQLICQDCSRDHVERPELSDHSLDLLSTWLQPRNSEKMLRRASLRPVRVCSQHGYQLRHYCVQCSSTNCLDCLVDHKGHDIRQVENAVGEAKNIITQQLLIVGATRKELEQAAKVAGKVRDRLCDQESKREEDINAGFARIRKEFESCQKTMLLQLKSISDGKKSRLSIQLQQLQGLANRAARLEALMHDVVAAPNLSQLFNLADFLVMKSYELEKSRDTVRQTAPLSPLRISANTPSLTPCEAPTLAVQIPTGIIHSALRDQCSIYCSEVDASKTSATGPGLNKPRALEMTYFKVHFRDSKGQPCNETRGLTIKCFSQFNQVEEHVRHSSVSQGILHVTYTPRTSTEYKIQVQVGKEDICGSPFIVPVQPARLLSADLQPKLLSSLEALKQPAHITIGMEDIIYIVEEDGTVWAFNQDGNEALNFEQGPTESPGGIVLAEDGSLLVTSAKYHCIAKFSTNGRLVATKGRRGSLQQEFDGPTGLSIKTSTGELFVCDKNNHRVQVFDASNLEYLRMFSVDFTTKGFAKPAQPMDIYLSSHGPFYITDAANSCILVFSSDETFQFSWGPQLMPSQTCLKTPRSIMADADGIMYVSDNQCVLALQVDGDHVGTFKDQRMLSEPLGIAVDNNGQVYVCDTGRKAIAVFKDTIVKVT